jgi:tRNA(Ile)-lysidine synthase
MIRKFEQFIQYENLFSEDDRILLAVSGGMDSVVMTDLFSKLKIPFAIAHCNFQLRGKESDGDEKFVLKLAQKHRVTFFSTKFSANEFSKKNKISIQEAARKLRYDWFEEIRSRHQYDYIATAHHANDSIETFFINLLRGTGIEGLKGIPVKNENIIRPLLFATQTEIKNYASKRKIKFRLDSSNEKDDYLRNKIRHQVIPSLQKLNPQFEKVMTGNMQRLNFSAQLFSKEIKKTFARLFEEENKTWKASISQLQALPEAEQFLFYFLQPMNFKKETVEEILQNHQSGKKFFSQTHRLIIDRDTIIIQERTPAKEDEAKIEVGQKTFSNEIINLGFSYLLLTSASKAKIPKQQNTHWLDASALRFPLQVRRWKAGDRFSPMGMKGKKKVSDYLIDKKISLFEKEKTFVLLSGNQIVCILGHRIDEHFKVTAETKKIFCIEVKKI